MLRMTAKSFLSRIGENKSVAEAMPNKAVIVFHSEDCEFCDEFLNQVDCCVAPKVKTEDVEFWVVEVDDEISEIFSLTILPALGVFKKGFEYGSKVGLFSEDTEELGDFAASIDDIFGGK